MPRQLMAAGLLGALLAVGTSGLTLLGPGLAHSAGGWLLLFVIPGLLGGATVGDKSALYWIAFLACRFLFYAALMVFIGMVSRERGRQTLQSGVVSRRGRCSTPA
jgi:hypothetical protein